MLLCSCCCQFFFMFQQFAFSMLRRWRNNNGSIEITRVNCLIIFMKQNSVNGSQSLIFFFAFFNILSRLLGKCIYIFLSLSSSPSHAPAVFNRNQIVFEWLNLWYLQNIVHDFEFIVMKFASIKLSTDRQARLLYPHEKLQFKTRLSWSVRQSVT